MLTGLIRGGYCPSPGIVQQVGGFHFRASYVKGPLKSAREQFDGVAANERKKGLVRVKEVADTIPRLQKVTPRYFA